jgi:SAM-dependent methyltransferase
VAELVCPRDRSQLDIGEVSATCAAGHRYDVVAGVPVLMVAEVAPTHPVAELAAVEPIVAEPVEGIDPVVQQAVAATCGFLYRPLIGRMTEYPIPELRLPSGEGRTFLEVGCHWGRWCVAAARRGYVPTGIDPSLEAILAARRVAKQLQVEAEYVVADGRHLPFPDATFDVVFSYSVFQHFSRDDAVAAFQELGRVLKPGGTSLVQLANVWGARSLWNQLRERRFREPRRLFDVRYWSPRELSRELERAIGPTRVFVDGFLTLNPQPSDLQLLPRRYRTVVRVSEALRKASERVRPLTYVADSLYASSTR